jgi:hypothetical protein
MLETGRNLDSDSASGGFVNCKPFQTFICVSIALGLAACGPSPYAELSVEPTMAQPPIPAKANHDQALADKVKKALEGEAGMSAQSIEVTATNGTVQLWGLVDSTNARKRIEQIVSGVVGVHAVDSRLVTDPGA